ncbi:uncharacterized protein LOC111242361 isoform X2 [Vigna radiata var. radiata]|uniref:Uncharacterized protein LOC111242361 isoform X2 n=1 Tax=Vigna radiata var. radiata TaxID=3916 RepID=A0A3Q0FBE9_VIGRR|nr:uncharacterized protein LOC111242361 isoform X2 [Vigna radiata var. radiata]
MAHQEYSGIISDEVRDEIRLYECARKYETIVKQFDELMGIMNNDTTVPIPKTKWRKAQTCPALRRRILRYYSLRVWS